MPFHTGLTPTNETSLHTGLSPIDEGFPMNATWDDSQTQGVLPNFTESSWMYDFTHSNFDFSEPLLFVDESLIVQPDSPIEEPTKRNSLDPLLDTPVMVVPTATTTYDSVPSFLKEDDSYGSIVGPSEDIVPQVPLYLQQAAKPVEVSSTSAYSQPAGFEAGYAAANNGLYSDIQQTTSTLPVGDGSAGLDGFDNFDMTAYDSTFDLAGTSFADLSQYDPIFQVQDTQTRKVSDTSAQSSTSPPPGVEKKLPPSQPIKYQAELPRRPGSKPWIRVNASTKGKNSRSGKINQYEPSDYYSKVPHPTGAWTSSHAKEFTYNQWHEFSKNDFTASQLKDFIYQHPKSKDSKLTLYIQRSPADSKRRYPTSTLDKCRFSSCPMRVHGNKGTFLHGHYRVALDELSYKYGNNGKEQHNDPFQVAGYVHLYCLERFLDLPEICRLPNVKVEADSRQMAKEPNGTFAPALGGSECRVAMNFIEVCRKNTLPTNQQWLNYPSRNQYRVAEQTSQSSLFAVHRHTLNYALQMAKNIGRGGYVMKKQKPSNVAVHRGDIEMYCLSRKNLLSDEEIAAIIAEIERVDAASALSDEETAAIIAEVERVDAASAVPVQASKRRASGSSGSVNKKPKSS